MAESAQQRLEACRDGDRLALARIISTLENPEHPQHAALADMLAPLEFPRRTIGLTGPPGVGKSTLIDELVSALQEEPQAKTGLRGSSVAVLAVDPSSPFTGGALLGDRVRMDRLRNDPRVFIRSLGSRDAVGGLAGAVGGTLRALALAGFERVFLETVGAGQAEMEVIHFADTVCVLQTPGLGDEVQLMKMGILEAADILVVSKSDRPGADDLRVQLEQSVAENTHSAGRIVKQLGSPGVNPGENWRAPVVMVSANARQGTSDLLAALDAHGAYLERAGLRTALREARMRHEIVQQACYEFRGRAVARLGSENGAALSKQVSGGEVPFSVAVARMLEAP